MEFQTDPEGVDTTVGVRSGLPRFAGRFSGRPAYRPQRDANGNLASASRSSPSPNGRRAGSLSPADTSSSSSSRVASPIPRTRIPRPSPSRTSSLSSRRSWLGLADAYKMAEAEEAALLQGSPSPAPRPSALRRDSHEAVIQSILKQRPSDLGRRRSSRQSDVFGVDDELMTSRDSGDERRSAIRRVPMQHVNDLERMDNATRSANTLFSKAKVGPKVAETGKELSRKTSTGSLREFSTAAKPRSWGLLGTADPNFARRLMESPEAAGSRGPENSFGSSVTRPSAPRAVTVARTAATTPPQDIETSIPRPTTAPPPVFPANKSFAWEADQDFTAGDLQVSASPPVKMAKKSKLDEIKSFRPRNTKLDEIRKLENDVTKNYRYEEPPVGDSRDDVDVDFRPEMPGGLHNSTLAGRSNTKIDDIRAREIESLSKRALATARLNEIGERNSESRSLSPEAIRNSSSREPIHTPSPGPSDGAAQVRPSQDKEDDHKSSPPALLLHSPSSESGPDQAVCPSVSDAAKHAQNHGDMPKPLAPRPVSPGDSQDILRRLSRAACPSPAPAQQQPKRAEMEVEPESEDLVATYQRGGGERTTRETKGRLLESLQPRPTDLVKGLIGTSGLRRVASSDSNATSSKRSSVANSESDPTDRIEAEMSLFAPMEYNQSEKGSTRAPSPGFDESEDGSDAEKAHEDNGKSKDLDQTPRATKRDVKSLPTPKVTGAYVDTPATIKSAKTAVGAHVSSTLAAASLTRNRGRPKSVLSSRQDNDPAAQTSSADIRRRAKSLPRARSPLINSVKLPSAKDDLLEIHRRHQIDDSTLDDFDGLLAPHIADKFEERDPVIKTETELVTTDADIKLKSTGHGDVHDRGKEELEAYDRMNRSLRTGLLGIQTAKKGIERLEDQVSQSKAKAGVQLEATADAAGDHSHSGHQHDHKAPYPCPICAGVKKPVDTVTYVHFPVPRICYRQPKFRLSLLGLVLLLAATWLAAESAVCARFCKPVSCGPGDRCNWSPDDPFFGYAIPVKLDQWTTGGKGRELAGRLSVELGDRLADAHEYARGIDITKKDTRRMSIAQKREHRRRLLKKGLIKPWSPPPSEVENVNVWAQTRIERERAEVARAMGYEVGDGLGDDSIDGDEKVSSAVN